MLWRNMIQLQEYIFVISSFILYMMEIDPHLVFLSYKA
jgi:hypothetical protein